MALTLGVFPGLELDGLGVIDHGGEQRVAGGRAAGVGRRLRRLALGPGLARWRIPRWRVLRTVAIFTSPVMDRIDCGNWVFKSRPFQVPRLASIG